MKWVLYNILFLAVYPFLLPGFLLRMLRRGGYAARMGDRFALYPERIRAVAGGCVWIHAVSVGEVQVAGQLMREWRRIEPDVRFCFSTTSSTGWKMAEREVTERDVLIYFPLDFPTFVKAALLTMRPRAVVMTESEIWPNFILRAKRMGIPLFLVNARVSDRSAPRYKAARFFFGDVFRCFKMIFAQSDLDAMRIRATYGGRDVGNIAVVGSFKFDVAKRNETKEKELLRWIYGDESEKPLSRILLGCSTWPGEDAVLLGIYKRILETCSDAVLVIAPRHFEKADAVEANINAAGFSCIRRSRGDSAASACGIGATRPVFLADTTGELVGLCGIAHAVFVGKSLCAHGSQNMIEPCLCGKPTVVGPYTENFRPVMSDLLSANAIIQVGNSAELEMRLAGLFTAGGMAYAIELGERARKAVERRRGVVEKCAREIAGSI